MNKKRAQQIFNALNKASKQALQKKKFSFSYKSDFLEYKSYLSNFSTDQYQLFDNLFDELEIQDSIRSLLNGAIVNQTENRPALHHRYRCSDPIPDFNFQKICAPLLKQMKTDKYQNIITFGIGGSYEGPKLLQEFLFKPASNINYSFVSGPDKDEFNSVVKPYWAKRIYIFFPQNPLLLTRLFLVLSGLEKIELKKIQLLSQLTLKVQEPWDLVRHQ